MWQPLRLGVERRCPIESDGNPSDSDCWTRDEKREAVLRGGVCVVLF